MLLAGYDSRTRFNRDATFLHMGGLGRPSVTVIDDNEVAHTSMEANF
jgi:hypothetical protein